MFMFFYDDESVDDEMENSWCSNIDNTAPVDNSFKTRG